MKVNQSRRSFMRRAGTALSGPVAAAVAVAPKAMSTDSTADAERARLIRLEDENAIRDRNLEHMRHVNAEPIDLGAHDVIEIAADRRSARALVHVKMEIQNPILPEHPLIGMAREQGGGIVRETEHGVFVHEYIRLDGVWTIRTSNYRLE